ncbi:MAG: DUF4407 domain-containing protein [Betaproteobacteria bacterium]
MSGTQPNSPQPVGQAPLGGGLPLPVPPANPSALQPGINPHPALALAANPLPQLSLPKIQQFFLWLAKTDIKAIAHCTPEALMGQTTLGAMVLLTGIMAFGSSFFTVWSIVDGQFSFALMVPIIYASAIMMFDRELVGFVPDLEDGLLKKFLKMTPRLAFAVVLGYAIAIPVEMKVFERRIESEVMRVVKERNKESMETQQNAKVEIAAAKAELKDKVAYFKQEIARVQKLMNIEFLDRNGRGPRYESFQSEKEKLQAQYEAAEAEYVKFSGTTSQLSVVTAEGDKVTKEYNELRRDLLARAEALERIRASSSAANGLAGLLTVVFMLFELFPMVLKLFSKYNEYHAYLNARKAINIQKAHVLANYALTDIEANPRNAVLYGEYTDMIQIKSEDAVGTPDLTIPAPPSLPQGPMASPAPAATPLIQPANP